MKPKTNLFKSLLLDERRQKSKIKVENNNIIVIFRQGKSMSANKTTRSFYLGSRFAKSIAVEMKLPNQIKTRKPLITMEIRSVLLWIPDYVTQVFDAT